MPRTSVRGTDACLDSDVIEFTSLSSGYRGYNLTVSLNTLCPRIVSIYRFHINSIGSSAFRKTATRELYFWS